MKNRRPFLIIIGATLIVVGAALGIAKIQTVKPATISSTQIDTEYFSGQSVQIQGTSVAAKAAHQHAEERFAAFAQRATTEVPELREQFGPEAPAGTYELRLDASVISGTNTESIVIAEYEYTGGANGMSTYTTFTSLKKGGDLLSLRNIIRPDQTEAFTNEVRNRLTQWAEETEGAMLFAEDVSALTFDSFYSWSLSEDMLTIYFSKYAVGPGAIGAITIPLPLSELAAFLQ